MPIYIVVGVGLVGTIVSLVMALRGGRARPAHRVPWWIAVIALAIDSALHAAISTGAVIQGGWESTWIVLGSLAIIGVFVTALIQPRIAGWWLMITAIVLPIILVVGNALLTSTEDESVPIGVLLGFYSTRMFVIGGLLVWCASPRHPGSDSSGPQSEVTSQRARPPRTTDPERSSSAS